MDGQTELAQPFFPGHPDRKTSNPNNLKPESSVAHL
jgi:hypothetical protein